MRTTTVMLDGKPEPVRFVAKRNSRLHSLIARLPLIPDAYMARFWTTIGSTIYVPDNSLPLNREFTASWKASHLMVIRHEARHARRARRLTLPLYATLYLGPSLTMGPLSAILSAILSAVGVLPWACVWIACVITLGLLPFSIGFALFRAWDEADAYREYVAIDMETRVAFVANMLWRDYAAAPPFIGRWLLRRAVRKA